MFRRPFLSALLLTVIAFTACRAAAPPTGKIGQRIEYQSFAITVNKVEEATDFPGARKARAGYKLVAVELIVENQSSKSGAHWDPDHTRLVERGNRADHKAHTQGHTPVLTQHLNMAKGEKLQGWLTYEVADGVRAMDFEYELPTSFNNTILKFQLDK